MIKNKAHHFAGVGMAMIVTLGCANTAAAEGLTNGIAEQPLELEIEAQPIGDALNALAQQSGLQLVFFSEVAGDLESRAAVGEFESSEAALEYLLADTGLDYRFVNERTVSIQGPSAGAAADEGGDSDSKNSATATVLMAQNTSTRAAETPARSHRNDDQENQEVDEASEEDERLGRGQIETIVVRGTRNVGIRRYEDDAQPYVVFDATEIETSAATSIDEFLRTRLPQNASASSPAQQQGLGLGNQSSFDLRGLGTDQTLVLVNGRRQPNTATLASSSFGQPDINGIPLSAVERIEVLPSTASGIYGGGATGGVINVILKRDYAGADVTFGYDNTFDSDVAQRRIDGSAGFSLEGGRTNILVSGSYSDSNTLTNRDRDFAARSRELLLQNSVETIFDDSNPPASATPNIRSTDGSDLVLDDGASLGSPFTYVPVGYAGFASDGGAALAENAGAYNLDLPENVLGTTLLNAPTREYASVTVRREFTDWLELFGEYSIAETESFVNGTRSSLLTAFIPAGAPTNPFQQTIAVTYPFPSTGLSGSVTAETTNYVVGATAKLPRKWLAQLDYTKSFSATDSDFVNQPFGFDISTAVTNGELDVIRDLNAFPPDFSPFAFPEAPLQSRPADSELETYSLRLSGPTIELPGGPTALTLLLERREQGRSDSFSRQAFRLTSPPILRYGPPITQDVNSAYIELLAPLVAGNGLIPFVDELELQLAVRYDEYETTADAGGGFRSITSPDELPDIDFATTDVSSTDFTVGLRYVPFSGWLLRASYGTGFLPPSVSQIGGIETISDFTRFQLGEDPKRGNIRGTNTQPITVLDIGNPDLDSEESESFSVGVRYTPSFVDGLTFSVDYTKIKKEDEIEDVISPFNALQFEDLIPGIVTRAALTPEDAALGYTAGEVIGLDLRLINVASSEVSAYDFQVNYNWPSSFGDFEFYGIATLQTTFERQILPETDVVDRVGFATGPLEWRGNVGVNWYRGSWALGWNLQYYDSYIVYSPEAFSSLQDFAVEIQGTDTIPSQAYNDVFVRYELGSAPRWGGPVLANMEFRIGVQNVFDEKPPILATRDGLGGYSTFGDPRLRRYSIVLRKTF